MSALPLRRLVSSWLLSAVMAVFTGAMLLFGWRVGRVGLGSAPWSRRAPDHHFQLAMTPPVALAILAAMVGVPLTRRYPRIGFTLVAASLVAYCWSGGFRAAMLVPLAVAVYLVVRRLGIADALPWLGAVPLIAWSSWWGDAGLGLADASMWAWLLSTTIFMAGPALLAILVTTRTESRSRQRTDELDRAASAERLRLVRDIHDVVGHSLSMITLQSGVALRLLDSDPEQARTSLEAIRDSSRKALAEVRHTLGVVKEQDPAAGPLAPTPELAELPQLIRQVNEAGGDVSLTSVDPGSEIPSAVGTAVYRVVQESLTNTVRHAPGAKVEVHLARDARRLVVRIADNAAPRSGFVEGAGLRGMRERVEALAGTFDAQATQRGFVVVATFPLPANPGIERNQQ